MNDRKFAQRIFLILILLLFSGCSQNKFLQYSESVYGITVNCPRGWEIQENKGGTLVAFISPKEREIDPFSENVNIVVQDLSANPMTLKQYTETAVMQMKRVFKNIELSNPVSVKWAGQEARKLEYIVKAEFDLKVLHQWMIKDNKAYQFTFIADKDHYDAYLPTVRAMIDSFTVNK